MKVILFRDFYEKLTTYFREAYLEEVYLGEVYLNKDNQGHLYYLSSSNKLRGI